MHKPIDEKKPGEPAPKDACNCTCGEAQAKDCPKYDPPPVNVATKESANFA